MLKVVIDRSHWDVYQNKGVIGTGCGRLLRFIKGHELRCCLGFVGSTVGIEDSDLLNCTSPITSSKCELFPNTLWITGDPRYQTGLVIAGSSKISTDAAMVLMYDNDNVTLTAVEREYKIKANGLLADIEFEFVGEYLSTPLLYDSNS